MPLQATTATSASVNLNEWFTLRPRERKATVCVNEVLRFGDVIMVWKLSRCTAWTLFFSVLALNVSVPAIVLVAMAAARMFVERLPKNELTLEFAS